MNVYRTESKRFGRGQSIVNHKNIMDLLRYWNRQLEEPQTEERLQADLEDYIREGGLTEVDSIKKIIGKNRDLLIEFLKNSVPHYCLQTPRSKRDLEMKENGTFTLSEEPGNGRYLGTMLPQTPEFTEDEMGTKYTLPEHSALLELTEEFFGDYTDEDWDGLLCDITVQSIFDEEH